MRGRRVKPKSAKVKLLIVPHSYYVKQTVSEGCDKNEVLHITNNPFRGDCHEKDNIESLSGQTLFVGIDVHKKSFHVTFRTFDCEMSSQSIPASWSALKKLLSPFKALDIEAVYEADYFGYWLYRRPNLLSTPSAQDRLNAEDKLKPFSCKAKRERLE